MDYLGYHVCPFHDFDLTRRVNSKATRLEMRYLYALIALTICSATIYATFYQGASSEQLGFEGGAVQALAVAGTALTLVLGVFFGCLFRKIGGPDRQIDLLKELSTVIRSSSFVASLCVSPFIFFAVYAIVHNAPGEPASYLLAFQNRFFCQAIFNRMFNEDGTQKKDPIPSGS
jgi:hypothetical protein